MGRGGYQFKANINTYPEALFERQSTYLAFEEINSNTRRRWTMRFYL